LLLVEVEQHHLSIQQRDLMVPIVFLPQSHLLVVVGAAAIKQTTVPAVVAAAGLLLTALVALAQVAKVTREPTEIEARLLLVVVVVVQVQQEPYL
jgi:hypothetical protein